MNLELIVAVSCCVAIIVVLARISLTLNEISASLRRIARQRSGEQRAASTLLHEARTEAAAAADAAAMAEGEAEIAAAIAVARATLNGGGTIGGSGGSEARKEQP